METLDVLPGEGEEQTIRRVRSREECEICGEPAHFKHTFLLDNARRNPASSAYRHDDCSWCSDLTKFVCKEHKENRTCPDGYGWCSTFSATERFAHMFLCWRESKC